MSEVEVWIDQRERFIIPYFDSLDMKKIPPYNLSLKTLSAGDYAVVYKDWIIMLIERKSWADLAATFLDRNRKFNYEKMLEERKIFGCHLFYLVEGKRPYDHVGHLSVDTLEAHLDHLYFDHNIVTIFSQSAEKTPEKILNLVKHYMTSHSKPFQEIEKKVNERDIKAGRIKTKVVDGGDENGNKNKGIDNDEKEFVIMFEDEIPSAEGNLTTPKKHSDTAIEYKLWNCIEGVTEQNYVALTDIGTKLSGILTGQYTPASLGHAKYRLGTLVSEKKLSKMIDSARQLDTHVKVLSNIPGISIHRAKYILQSITMSDIVTGIADENKIAEIQIPAQSGKTKELGASKRLGNAAAKNIIKYLRNK